jgi:AcrR family transcriptional regulator
MLSTRVMILNEAERLIAQKGVFGFTLDNVAAPLKVRVPSIYKHFASRDDVLIEVSKRFINALSLQFAYVRLSLVDLATPEGGAEYVKRAAGGPFRANFRSGPLAPMHRRLAKLLAAGQRAGEFRKVPALDFYRLLQGALLIRLVFPDDQLHRARRSAGRVRRIKSELWNLVARYLATGAAAR